MRPLTQQVWRETAHAARKLRSTARLLFCMGMARTFGQYRHTAHDDTLTYAVYRWRGQWWAIPTEPMHDCD